MKTHKSTNPPLYLVEVNGDYEHPTVLGPFSHRQEALWRAEYERRCAVEIYGNQNAVETKVVRL